MDQKASVCRAHLPLATAETTKNASNQFRSSSQPRRLRSASFEKCKRIAFILSVRNKRNIVQPS